MMILKAIRETFQKIEGFEKSVTAFNIQSEQALRLSENLEKMKEVREKMMVTGEEMSKRLEERSKQMDDYMKEARAKAQEEIQNNLPVQMALGVKLSKLTDLEILKQYNKRKMDGQPLRRVVAERKVRKKKT